jgi:apolipoprotein N-acyltransferase
MIALLCTVATALAFALAYGTPDLWPLAWLAPVPIVWLALGERRAWTIALCATVGYLVGELGMLWPYVKPAGGVVIVAAVSPAIAFALVVLAARLVDRRTTSPTLAALTFAALWTGWEWLSSTRSPHGSFGAWGYSQVDAPVLIQSASLFGVWIIGFLIAFVAAAVALSIHHRRATPALVALALVVANVAYGGWQLRRSDGQAVRVAASARDHDDRAGPDAVSNAQALEARRLAAQGATMIVFPEKGALLPDARRDAVLAPLVAAARAGHTMLATGFDQTGAQRRNVAYVVDDGGRVTSYTKRHHIPGLESGYTIGEKPGLLGARRAVAICKDLDFQGTLRGDAASARDGGGLGVMLVPAWDFGSDGWLHARMAIMRGVEGGYAVVRAAANGLVTVSDARGRVVARRASGRDAYASVTADVAMGSGETVYVRIGDAFAWIVAAVGVMVVCIAGLRAPTHLMRGARGSSASTEG